MDYEIKLTIMLALYCLPAIIAYHRDRQNAGAIFALNVFTGWTLIGWVGALVWALTASRQLPETRVSASR